MCVCARARARARACVRARARNLGVEGNIGECRTRFVRGGYGFEHAPHLLVFSQHGLEVRLVRERRRRAPVSLVTV